MRNITRFSAFFLILTLLLPLLGCAGSTPDATTAVTTVPVTTAPTTPNTPDTLSDEAYFADFQPVLRFAALSDTHIDDRGTELEEQRLVKVLQTAKEYGKLDAVLIVGDFVDNGTLTSMEKVKGLLTENTDADTKHLVSLGNHEYYVERENTAARFESVFGAPIHEHQVINGFHFIKISPDETGNAYAPATISWLDAELAAAAADDPTKPIFVMQHHAAKNTLYYSDYRVAVDNLHPVLAKYPQVVDFSGHSHYPMHNPRQIWQGEYTALGTGTLSYHSLIINNLELPPWYSAVHDGTDGSWVLGHKKNKDGGEFYLVQVDAKGAVMIIAYDVNADAEICRYYIRTPSDPTTFRYTNARIAASQAPVFPANATAAVSNILYNGFDLTFPQASCEDMVESYRVEVYSGEELVNTTILTSCFYLTPQPTTMVAKVRGLQASTTHTVKVFAVNAYNKDCTQPLTATVTTAVLDLTAAETAPNPDIFQTVFDKNGSFDAISGEKLTQVGGGMIGTSPSLQRSVAVLLGNACFTFDGFSAHHAALSKSVSFETVFKVNDFMSSSYVPFGNMQNGGLGFQIDANGMMKFSVYVDSSIRTVTSYPLEVDQYYHLVGTYDGQMLRIYVNGAPVNELAAPGKITWPTDETAQYLTVGGDTGLNNKPETTFRGELVAANVYSGVLSAEEVYRIYLDSGL